MENVSDQGIPTVSGPSKAYRIKDILLSRYFLYPLSLFLFFSTWELLAVNNMFGMPRIGQVIATLTDLSTNPLATKTLWGHIGASLKRVAAGYIIAVILGVPIGILMATNLYFKGAFKPIFDMLKPMPPIAWIPIAILWFGVGDTSKVFLIIIGTIIPCIINTYNGIRLVDPELYDVIRVLGGKRRDLILQVTFPAAFPAIFSGLQLALSFAWSCVVAAELVSSRSGVGYLIILGMKVSDSSLIIGGMAVIAFIAWLVAVILGEIEKKICPWRVEIDNL
jgi:NitT/TauT family transport system permease protein/sulfonate transport system permease protein